MSMLHWTECVGEELFTHFGALGRQTTYAASRIRKFCETSVLQTTWKQGEPLTGVAIVKVPIEQQHAEYSMRERGVEAHRLLRLDAEHLVQPLLFVLHPDDTWLLIDGTHRYVRLFQLGLKHTTGWVVPFHLVEQNNLLVELPAGMNEDSIKNSWSGM